MGHCPNHMIMAFAHTQAAYGIAWKIELHELLSAFRAEVQINTALHNGKEQLSGIGMGLLAARSPLHRAFDGCLKLIGLGWKVRTLVKAHDDICAKSILDIRGDLCIELILPTV